MNKYYFLISFCLIIFGCQSNTEKSTDSIKIDEGIFKLAQDKAQEQLADFYTLAMNKENQAFVKVSGDWRTFDRQDNGLIYSFGKDELKTGTAKSNPEKNIQDWLIELPGGGFRGGYSSQAAILMNQHNGKEINKNDAQIPNFKDPFF